MAQDNFQEYQGIDDNYATPPSAYPFGKEEQKSASIIKQLSPEEHLETIMMNLKGMLWDKKKQKYVQIEGANELMNEEGRNKFFHYATSILSSIVTISNYTNDYKRVHAITRMVVKSAIFHFHIHYKDYKMERTSVNIVTSKLLVLGLSAMYKAIGAGDRKAGTSNIHESISSIMRPPQDVNPQNARRGWSLSRIFGGGG